MIEINEKAIAEFYKAINAITKEDKVAVFHHTDPDGVSSGVIAAKAIEKLRGKKIDLQLNQGGNEISVTKKTALLLKRNKINFLITTDLCVDQNPEYLYEVAKSAKIIVIDHHRIYCNLNEKGIVMVKAEYFNDFIEPYKYACAKLCYDLFKKAVDISDIDWIAAAGAIGDGCYPSWKEFVDAVVDKYNIQKNKEIFNTQLGRVASLISDVECYSFLMVGKGFWTLYNSKNYKDFLNSGLKKYSAVIRKELEKEEKRFYAVFKKDKGKKAIIFELKSRFNLRSNLITRLGFRHPDKTFVFYHTRGNKTVISARSREGRIKVNDLLEKCCKDLGGIAGGHIVAAGATISRKDLSKFLKNLKALLQE